MSANRGSAGRRPTVAIGSGVVRGLVDGNDVAAFRGIPYAASPVGALRFTAPRPCSGWSGVREAMQAGPSVPQGPSRLAPVMGARVPDGDEDGCLTVNVWTPEDVLADGAVRPVLVWLHGGAFTSGCGGWDWYDGARLAALGDMVVVTANYRLGPLGYLYLPEIGADNLGCQDQRAVLRWVGDNIAAFGGDPTAITVAGQSAGASSALSLALDPVTSGQVRRLILQSGSWVEPKDPAEATETTSRYLHLLGIDHLADPGPRLRELPIDQLLAAFGRLAAETARHGSALPPMYPVRGGVGRTRSWGDAIAEGALTGKDVLLGSTENEMSAFFAFNPAIQAMSRTDVLRVLSQNSSADAEQLYDRYAARRADASPAEIFTAIATDQTTKDGLTTITQHCAAQGNPAYVYLFTRSPQPDPHRLGACHCADLPFTFGTFDAYPDAPMLATVSDTDRTLARAFGGALTAFAVAGSPNRDGLQPWHPYVPGPTPEIKRF